MIRFNKTGYWSAVLSIVFAIGYIIPQILSEFKLIPYPHDLFWLFLPSLFLAPSFLASMVCLHYSHAGIAKVYTAIAIGFATVYCVYASMVYFTQLSVILPAQFKNEAGDKQLLVFPGRSVMMAVDCLGYGYMSLATLFASFAFYGSGGKKWLYRSLFINGLLAPVVIFVFFYPSAIYAGALWIITFPLAMINVAKVFKTSSTVSVGIRLEV